MQTHNPHPRTRFPVKGAHLSVTASLNSLRAQDRFLTVFVL